MVQANFILVVPAGETLPIDEATFTAAFEQAVDDGRLSSSGASEYELVAYGGEYEPALLGRSPMPSPVDDKIVEQPTEAAPPNVGPGTGKEDISGGRRTFTSCSFVWLSIVVAAFPALV